MFGHKREAKELIEMEDNFKELLLQCRNERQEKQIRGKLDKIHKKFEQTYIN